MRREMRRREGREGEGREGGWRQRETEAQEVGGGVGVGGE